MFRRSRFSIRPNVGTAGRAAATSQEAPSASQEASETPKEISESNTAVTDNKTVVTPSEKSAVKGDGNEQNVEGTSSSAAVQRRKRFSIKPKVAPGRVSTLSRLPKSPAKAVSETAVEAPVSDIDKPTTSSQTALTAAPRGLQSPRRRRLSEDKQPKVQPKAAIISSDISEPSVVPPSEVSPEQTHLPADSGKELESTSGSPVKEVPSRLPDKVTPSLPDKEAFEISEKAKTLVSSKSGLSLSPPAFSLSRLLNDPSDLQRIAKAQKLRDLLRQEMHKEKKSKKAKVRVKEFTLDPAKMTMRDLIRYLPESNPMTSSLEESVQENETVVPPSPGREESPERAQEPEVLPKITSPREEEEEEANEDQDDQEAELMVPQVKVAEDGTLIIDEESLTVEVQRAKGPNLVQERDPIFERGSTTTYSSFRKGTYSKPWSSEETDMFLLAISMVGTDFSMICQLFPHRARSEIKNKFKKEERENAWRIDKAFRERRKLDIEYFSKLLEKILEVQKNRKKLKSLADKNSPKKQRKKTKGKKASKKLSDVGEEDEEEENEMPDLEGEGEKENEDLCNEGGTLVSKTKKKRKRKNDASTEEPSEKKNKTGEKSNEQEEACIPEDAEAALPEDSTNSNLSEKTDDVNLAKDTTIKPAKLSRGRAPKPLLPLGRKWGKKAPQPSTKAGDTEPDKEDESVNDDVSEEQVNKYSSPLKPASKKRSADEVSSEEEDATVQPQRPTRYGRVPKPTKPLSYPAKADPHSSASETTPASPATASSARPKPKCAAKRGRASKQQATQESKKPKLVTLRASQTDYSDEENEKQWEEKEFEEEQHSACGFSIDSVAQAFVPASLRSPHPMISEVEETMEELDILANMPDVLGISQDALCPDGSGERSHNETGTSEPFEHQLDLLVDVIDLLSSEHTEVSEDQSYNEAAQTLLTIGNLAHHSQSAPNQEGVQDYITGTTSASVIEGSEHLQTEVAKHAAQEENSASPHTSVTSGHGLTETSETFTTQELQNTTADSDDVLGIKTSNQQTGSDSDHTNMLHTSPQCSKKDSPPTMRGRLSKVKPKPNVGQASRTAKSKFKLETSTARPDEESCTVVPNLSEPTEIHSAVEETPAVVDCCQSILSGSQERSVASTSDQSSSENHSNHINLTPDAQSEPSLKQTTRDSRSAHAMLDLHVGTTNISTNNLVTSATGLQIGQGTGVDSDPVQESSQHEASGVTPVEDVRDSQKQENEDVCTHQTRKSRFQKVKPKPNLAQTSRTERSKSQTAKESEERDSKPTPDPGIYGKTIVEVEEEPARFTSPTKPSQSIRPVSDSIPSLDLGSTLTPTKKLSTTEETKTDVGVVGGPEESVAATSVQSEPEKQNFSEAQVEPSREQTTGDTRSTPGSREEKQISCVETAESSCHNLLTPDSVVVEHQGEQGSNMDSAPVQESSDHLAPCVIHVDESPVSQKQDSEGASTSQTRRSRFQKVKPKPNLAQTSRTVRSKPQTTKDTGPASDSIPPLDLGSSLTPQDELPVTDKKHTDLISFGGGTVPPEKPSTASVSQPLLEFHSVEKPSEELSSTEQQMADVRHDSGSEGSQQNVPQRRQRFPKVKPKPNIGAFTRQTKVQSNDVSKDVSTTKLGSSESEKSLDGEVASSEGSVTATSWVAENPSMLSDSVLESESIEKATAEEESIRDNMSNNDKVEAGPASHRDCEQDKLITATETITQPTDDPTATEDASAESETKSALPTSTEVAQDPKVTTQLPQPKRDTESQHANNQTAAPSTDDDQSEPTDSSKSLRKAPQSRRGRFVKPKPNLGRSRQPPQLQQAQNTEQAEADSSDQSESVDASVSHTPLSDLRPVLHEPVEAALEQHTSPPIFAESSLSCVTQVPDNSTQDASSSGTGGAQILPSLSLFPDMLSGQVPSDPEEQFFILSLTEIPVCSSGQVLDNPSEPLPYLPVADVSLQHQSSVPGEQLAAAGDEHLSNVTVLVSMEESAETGLFSVNDTGPGTAAVTGSIIENPVDPQGSTAVEPSNLQETEEANEENEIPPTQQRLQGAARRGKRQVEPNASRKKQASRTVAAKEDESIPIETNTTQESELPGLSVQPREMGEVVTEQQKKGRTRKSITKEAVTGSKDPEDSSSGAQSRQTRGTRNRKTKDFLSETSNTSGDSQPSKAATKGQKVKAPRAVRKQLTPEPVASTSYVVPPTPTPTQTSGEKQSTPSSASRTRTEPSIEACSDQPLSASQSSAELFSSQQSLVMDSSSIEEATSVSQYFLSDIFTDVEEG